MDGSGTERRRPPPMSGAVTNQRLEDVLRPVKEQLEDHEIVLYGDDRQGREKVGMIKKVEDLMKIADKYKVTLALLTLIFNTATTVAVLILQYLQFIAARNAP